MIPWELYYNYVSMKFNKCNSIAKINIIHAYIGKVKINTYYSLGNNNMFSQHTTNEAMGYEKHGACLQVLKFQYVTSGIQRMY